MISISLFLLIDQLKEKYTFDILTIKNYTEKIRGYQSFNDEWIGRLSNVFLTRNH